MGRARRLVPDRRSTLATDPCTIAGCPRLVDTRVAPDVSCSTGLIDSRVHAWTRPSDVSRGPGLVDARVATDVPRGSGLVDSRVHAWRCSSDVPRGPGLIDTRVASDVACGPGLVDPWVTCENGAGQGCRKRTEDQRAHKLLRCDVHFFDFSLLKCPCSSSAHGTDCTHQDTSIATCGLRSRTLYRALYRTAPSARLCICVRTLQCSHRRMWHRALPVLRAAQPVASGSCAGGGSSRLSGLASTQPMNIW